MSKIEDRRAENAKRSAKYKEKTEKAKLLKAKGYSNLSIAVKLGVAESTVRNWLS